MPRASTTTETTKSPKAIGYIRVSTDEQSESGLGLETQREAIAKCAARLSLPLADDDILADEGVSGAKHQDKREGLTEALARLERGDVLIVAKRDRLARDVIVAGLLERFVTKKKARIVSAAGEGTDDDTPTGILMRRIIDAFAEYERLVIGLRTGLALRAKRRRGDLAGNVPFGYRAIPTGDGRTTKRGKPARRLEPDPREQLALAFMRARRAAGDSLRTIGRLMDAIHPARRGRWNPDSIRKILLPGVQTATTPVLGRETKPPGGPACSPS